MSRRKSGFTLDWKQRHDGTQDQSYEAPHPCGGRALVFRSSLWQASPEIWSAFVEEQTDSGVYRHSLGHWPSEIAAKEACRAEIERELGAVILQTPITPAVPAGIPREEVVTNLERRLISALRTYVREIVDEAIDARFVLEDQESDR